MKKTISTKLIYALLLLLGPGITGFSFTEKSAGDPVPEEIMEKTRETSQLKGMEAVTTLRIIDSRGRERVRQTSMASREYDGGDTEKRIIRFLAPAEVKGTGMLIYDYEDKNDDMWIYMPALRKTRRIISSEKSKSFMGSEFSNADMTAPNLSDFTYRILGTETEDGTECWVIESLPVSEDVMDELGYHRKVSWIGKQDFVQRKAEYYDRDDKIYKRMTSSDVRAIDPGGKKHMAMKMEMHNLDNGRSSVMTMDKVRYNPSVREEYFTLAYLEKI